MSQIASYQQPNLPGFVNMGRGNSTLKLRDEMRRWWRKGLARTIMRRNLWRLYKERPRSKIRYKNVKEVEASLLPSNP